MPTVRIPLSWQPDYRVFSENFDSLRLNAIDELAEGRKIATKRPGYTLQTSLGGGNGQGMTHYNGISFAVIGDTLRAVTAPPNTGTSGANWTVATAPPWSARGINNAVVFKDQIFVFGGTSTSDQGDVWASADGNTWRLVTGAAPFGSRSGMAACVFNGRIYVSGGIGNTTFGDQNDVWSSDDGANWVLEVQNCGWLPRDQHAMVAMGSGMFVLGGWNSLGTRFNDVWFSSDGQNWTVVTTAAAWSARQSFGCVVFNNKIYVVGGSDGAFKNDVYSSPDGKVWTLETAAAFASARSGIACVVYGGKIWALGGNAAGAVNDVYTTSTGTGAWTNVAPATSFTARYQFPAVVFHAPTSASTFRYPTLWVLGGNPTPTNSVYRGNLDTAVSPSFALTPPTAGQPFQFASFRNGAQLLIKNQSAMWIMSEGQVTRVTSAGYPPITVPGLVVLGGFAYVMDPTGLIYNCNLDDATSWQSINVIGADYEDDQGVCLAKYLNYVVAFGTYTTQVFYDAGNEYGSPLAPYLNANMRIGCADANSVVTVGTTLAWVGQTLNKRRQAVYFNGLTPAPMEDPFTEKFINSAAAFSAVPVTSKGQLFYVLSCGQNTTHAYSFSTKQWYPWLSSTGTAVSFSGWCFDFTNSNQLILSNSAGNVYQWSDSAYDEAGPQFTVRLRTPKIDGGTRKRKFWGQLTVVGDANPGTPSISYSDDDYATYTTARTVDMSLMRPALFRNGSSRARAFQYEQTDSNPIRVEALEQEFEVDAVS